MKMKHILIVDDDIHINKMLDEVLVHERYMELKGRIREALIKMILDFDIPLETEE